jgi:HTH-type transcriptional regulator/antitoxin HigA
MTRTTTNVNPEGARPPFPDYDEKKYGKLLSQTLPGVIRTEDEYDEMLKKIYGLTNKGEENLSPEETRLLELMSVLVEEYEAKNHEPIPDAEPYEVLNFLMEDRGLKPKDLYEIFGSRGYTSDVLSGKRSISKEKAKQLAEFFDVSAELFI